MMKKLQINDTRVNLAIWDTAGQAGDIDADQFIAWNFLNQTN